MKKIRKRLNKRSGRTLLSLLLMAALIVGGMTTVFATERDTRVEDFSVDSSYGLYGGYDGQDSMDDPDTAGACVGWDIATRSAVSSSSGLWWIDDYYIGENNRYDTEKTDDFSLKYQVEFHASEDLSAGAVQIVIDASLGTYRNGNNILPTDIGILYGTPENYATSSSSPFNYYYFYYTYDGAGNVTGEVVLSESQAASYSGDVYMKVWNYRDIVSGSNAMFQVLYKDMDIMQIADQTEWSLEVSAEVEVLIKDDEGNPTGETIKEEMNGNTLHGDVDTYATLNAVTKKAYTSTTVSYTPELYTESQVNEYINGSMPEPYASDFDDYIYIVWRVSFNGTATQAYEIMIDENTFFQDGGTNGSIVGFGTSSSTSGVRVVYGMDTDGNPTLSYRSDTVRSFSATFYVVTAYSKEDYNENDVLENDVTVTVHPLDGYDEDTEKSASATTVWEEYEWDYKGDGIGISKGNNATYSAYLTLYEVNSANEKDTGSFPFTVNSTDRGYALTHSTEGKNVGEWIEGSYYTTTTVDDALYASPNGSATPSRMLTKDDYYFSAVKITTTDSGYDVWEDKAASPEEYDGVDQSVYIYAMFYDADEDAMDQDGWEYVAMVPFSASGTMTYTFSSEDLARQPYRVKVVHATANYSTSCKIALSVMLRHDSPVIAEFEEVYGEELESLRVENLCGIAGQTYGVPGYEDGQYFQSTSTSGGNYSEKDTETGETLAQFTENLYGTILQRDNAYATLTRLEETAASYKTVSTENDVANGRVLANYTITAYEAYRVSGSSTVDTLKQVGISLPERHEVVYYDLLPYGMQFNASATVTAGRITTMSGSWQTNARAWDATGVTVTVEDSDVITNWNDTGRTMVIFHIHYDGDDASAYYNNLWFQGFGISFQAYYDWNEMDAVHAEYNIAAYIVEDVADESQQLLGAHDSTVFKDDGSASLSPQYAPFIDVADLNGDGVTDLYTNMYASTTTTTNVAMASSDHIKKTVRADDNAVAEYGATAVVGDGRTYTYEITLANHWGATLSDVVLFDRLEYAIEDGRYEVESVGGGSVFDGLTSDQIEKHWTGTFLGVTTTALDDLGIAAVVYYNADRDAVVSSADGEITPAEVLTAANGWYTEQEFIDLYGSLSAAKAIAVDISKKTDGTAFIMEEGSMVSIQIHMRAPDDSAYQFAFNNPMYYSVNTNENGEATTATDAGDTVRVEIGKAGTLEVEKEFQDADSVPASLTGQRFTFTLTRRVEMADGSMQVQILANQEYMIYNWDEETQDWIPTGVVSATDINGEFAIRADQKAVFSWIANVQELVVTEVESVLWDSTEERTDTSDTEASYVFKNKYRSPVYFYKTTRTTELASEAELEEAAFTFRILVDTDGDGEYEPYANGEYLYVQEVLTDGSSPSVDTSKGEAGHGRTDEEGCVTIRMGDILAFFPCDADGNYLNVPYRIIEISTGDDWVNPDGDTVDGTTGEYGTSETITNYYKYRNLILTKDLSDYDHDMDCCEDTWTFRLKMYDPENAHADEDGYVLVTGNHWYMIDADGHRVYTESAGGDPVPVEGYLDENGEFSFTGAGSGRRVVIEGLIESEKYTLTEVNYNEELYEQVNGGTADVTMPTYAITRSISITNKYLLKDLSVEKLVLTDSVNEEASAHEFTFTLEKLVDGAYVPVPGAAYTVDGAEHATGEDGTFTLKHGETAYFDDIGYQGDAYRITETPDGTYGQIYPANGAPNDVTLQSDSAVVRFINGDFDQVASLTKELVGLDDVGEAYVDIVKGDNKAETLAGEAGDALYAVDVTFGVYDASGVCVTDAAGALINYTNDNADYPYVYIKTAADGTYTLQSYNGGVMTETLAPYDYIYIAGIGDCIVKATEDDGMTRVLLDVTRDVSTAIGSDQILSEGDVMSGIAAANEDIVLVNNISSANKGSEIYKLMTKASDEVPAGSRITFIVERYDAASGTWAPAAGIKYITMDGYCGEKTSSDEATAHDTGGCRPTSGVLTTGLDGRITLVKTDEGYPYIRFIEDTIYANVYEDAADGTLRIIESENGTDEAWGLLVGYDAEGWIGGPAIDIPYADTFYNGNDDVLAFEVEKEMAEDTACEDDFTFYLKQILSASTSPIEHMEEILESVAGANIPYVIYDAETGTVIGEGTTDANGSFTLKPGQYAKFFVPEDTTWYVYEGVNPGYPLEEVTANSDKADNASIVDETHGVVQNAHSVYATGTIILTLMDSKDGETPLAGGTFALYKAVEDGDDVLVQSGLVTDENGQITVKNCAPGMYYFKETEAPSGYAIPEADTSDRVTVSEGLTEITEYEVRMENTAAVVNYAVRIWGIGRDTYLNEDGEERTTGLTLGPALGADRLSSYEAHLSEEQYRAGDGYCIHWMSWDEIIEWSATDPTVFENCLESGCTKSVGLVPNDTIFNMETVANARKQTYEGDGVSVFYYLLNGTGSASYTFGAIWNYTSNGYSDEDPANIYSKSRIRTTLIGTASDAELKYASSGGAFGDGADLCDESNCLFSCFPAELQTAIVARKVLANNTTYDKTTYDKLWLPSAKELGINGMPMSDNGVDYGIATSIKSRAVYEYSGTDAMSASECRNWWSRAINSNHYICAIVPDLATGFLSTVNVSTCCGLAPCFCLPGPEPEVRYAVKVWGIQTDTYSYDGGETTPTAGLTFGPALGADYLNSSVSCNAKYCIHNMSWEEIIAQSKADPTVFASCLQNGCTKAVALNLNETLGNQATIANCLNQGYAGDGVSTLYYLLNNNTAPAYAGYWNYSSAGYSADDPAHIYSKSRIRVTLNGDASDAELKYASSGGAAGDGSDLCDESNCLLSCFPETLQNAIVPRTVKGSTSSYDKTTYDKLWLPAASEVGVDNAPDNGVDYGIADSARERTAYEFSGKSATSGAANTWWSRSLYASNYAYVCYLGNDGIPYVYNVAAGGGLSPGFCLE